MFPSMQEITFIFKNSTCLVSSYAHENCMRDFKRHSFASNKRLKNSSGLAVFRFWAGGYPGHQPSHVKGLDCYIILDSFVSETASFMSDGRLGNSGNDVGGEKPITKPFCRLGN